MLQVGIPINLKPRRGPKIKRFLAFIFSKLTFFILILSISMRTFLDRNELNRSNYKMKNIELKGSMFSN